jgi:hypothetical protein
MKAAKTFPNQWNKRRNWRGAVSSNTNSPQVLPLEAAD